MSKSFKQRKIRELAMQALFAWDAHGAEEAAAAEQIVRDGSDDSALRQSALEAAGGAWRMRETTDAQLDRLAPQWPPRRQPGVDRAILRLAVWELLQGKTPPKVILDEAIELAKQFSTEQSAAFINGVLDAVLREQKALIQGSEIGERAMIGANAVVLESVPAGAVAVGVPARIIRRLSAPAEAGGEK